VRLCPVTSYCCWCFGDCVFVYLFLVPVCCDGRLVSCLKCAWCLFAGLRCRIVRGSCVFCILMDCWCLFAMILCIGCVLRDYLLFEVMLLFFFCCVECWWESSLCVRCMCVGVSDVCVCVRACVICVRVMCVCMDVVVWVPFYEDGGVAGLFCECVLFLSLVVDCYLCFWLFFCGDCRFLFCIV